MAVPALQLPCPAPIRGDAEDPFGPAAQARAEQDARAQFAGLLESGGKPRFLVEWFTLLECLERGGPLLATIVAASEAARRPAVSPAAGCSSCGSRWRHKLGGGPQLLVRVELQGAQSDRGLCYTGLFCSACSRRIAADRAAAEAGLIRAWFGLELRSWAPVTAASDQQH